MTPAKAGYKHLLGLLYWSILYGVITYTKGKGFDPVFSIINGAIFYVLMLVLLWLFDTLKLNRQS